MTDNIPIPSTTSTHILKDGRTLQYCTSALSDLPQTAPTVLYFHGFPGSHPEGDLLKPHPTRYKIRLITISRPGYALSTFQKNRTFLDWPNDILALMDHLQQTQFYVLGMSGGSPYVLACLASIPKTRLLGATIVSGAYPGGMSSKHTLLTNRLMAWAAMSWLYPILPTFIDVYAGRAARKDGDFEKRFMREIDGRHPKEIECLEGGGVRKAAVRSCTEAFRLGSQGMAWEAKLLSREWGIPLEGVDCSRLDFWYGRLDKNGSCDEAVSAAREWEGCRIHVVDDESHLSLLVNRSDEILAEMLAKRETGAMSS